MASNTNNNVNPLSMALSNSMPGAKPFGSSTGGYGNQTSTSSYAPSSSPSQAGPSVPNASAFSRFTGSPGGLMAQALAPSAPTSQAVKSHVVSPDGTVQQTYYDNSTGLLTKAGVAAGKPQVNAPKATQPAQQTAANGSANQAGQSNQPQQPSIADTSGNVVGSQQYDMAHGLPSGSSAAGGYQQPNSSSYSSLQSDLANQQNSPYNQAAQSAIGSINSTAGQSGALGQNAQQIANAAGEEIKNTGVYGANAGLGYQTAGGDQGFGLGGANAMANAAANRESAISAGANTALQGNSQALSALGQQGSQYGQAAGIAQTGQGQAQAAIGQAAGLAAPDANTAFYGNPLTGGLYGGGNSLVQTGVSNALQEVQNGADPAALRAQIQSQYGAPAAQAFDSALLASKNGGYNPTAASATAQQNTSQAVQYQQKATDLDTSLKNLDNASATAINTLSSSGLLSPTSNPSYNQAINTYIGSVKNPEAAAAYKTVIGELNNFKSQILAQNTGQTPTALTNYVDSTDPANLSAPQLSAYLQGLSILGGNQLSVYQAQSKASGGGGYAGTPSSVNTSLPISSSGGLGINTGQAGEAAAGAGISVAGGLEGILSGLAGTAGRIFSSI